MKYEETAKFFDYHCPYTDEMCKEWECDNCPVEQRERELTEVWQGYGTTITAPNCEECKNKVYRKAYNDVMKIRANIQEIIEDVSKKDGGAENGID